MKRKIFNLFALMTLLIASSLALITASKTSADEISNYDLNTSLTANGNPVTADTVISTWQTMQATMDVAFPDSQAINDGDTLTLSVPNQLSLITTLAFDVVNQYGTVVGRAVASPTDKTVTVTFTDQFSKAPENKKMILNFSVQTDRNVVADGSDVDFTWGNQEHSYQYGEETVITIDPYTYKYGYQSSTDSSRIRWKMIINAVQDPIRGMVISDQVGPGQYIIPESIRFIRAAVNEDQDVTSEADILSREVIDNMTDQLVYTYDDAGNIIGFTFGPYQNVTGTGDGFGWPFYIEYTTQVTDSTLDIYRNELTVTGTNFEERSRQASVRLQTGTGEADSEKSENVVLKADKILEGRDLKEGEFTFALYSADDLTTPLQTTTNAADGSITFQAIKYSAEGSYNYVIREVVPDEAAQDTEITYSDQEVTATVTVTDEQGVKMGSVTYGDVTSFTNTYTPVTTTTEETTTTEVTTTTEATTEVTTEIPTTTEEATTEATTEATSGGPITTESPKTTGAGASSSTSSTTKKTKGLPTTGEQAGLWMLALGLGILLAVATYYYRLHRR